MVGSSSKNIFGHKLFILVVFFFQYMLCIFALWDYSLIEKNNLDVKKCEKRNIDVIIYPQKN